MSTTYAQSIAQDATTTRLLSEIAANTEATARALSADGLLGSIAADLAELRILLRRNA